MMALRKVSEDYKGGMEFDADSFQTSLEKFDFMDWFRLQGFLDDEAPVAASKDSGKRSGKMV
jgi:hypothetical protein